MAEEPGLARGGQGGGWVHRVGRTRPDVVFMAPLLVYLLFLPLSGWLPKAYMAAPIVLRGLAGLGAFWLFRRYLPPLGKPHLLIAVVAGVFAAALWVKGQYILNDIHIVGKSLGGRLFLFPGIAQVTDPREGLSAAAWWSQAVLRIAVATITVPIVEEIFWRGFLLRAFIDWDRFEDVPLGTFTWLSFLGTSLVSTLEHPDWWGVSILCWFFYNALMYWKKSILCLIITHGVTNLVLYLYVLHAQGQAWQFW